MVKCLLIYVIVLCFMVFLFVMDNKMKNSLEEINNDRFVKLLIY